MAQNIFSYCVCASNKTFLWCLCVQSHSQISYFLSHSCFINIYEPMLTLETAVWYCMDAFSACCQHYVASVVPEHKLENFLVSKMGKPWISHKKYPTSISSVSLPLHYHKVNLYCWLYQSRHRPTWTLFSPLYCSSVVFLWFYNVLSCTVNRKCQLCCFNRMFTSPSSFLLCDWRHIPSVSLC